MKKRDKKEFSNIRYEILGQTIELISTGINNEYLRRFPSWPSSGKKEDYLNVSMDGDFQTNSL